MKKSSLHCLLSLFLFLHVNAQQINTKEFGFVSDNDLYVSIFLDGYYTNGLDLFFRKVSQKTKYKKISTFLIGQKIYNSYKHNVPDLIDHDRPYAGYTYGSFKQLRANNRELFEYGISVGYTGKYTGAKEAQNLIHKLYNIEETEGWNYEIKQQIEPRITLHYNRNLFFKKKSPLQISAISTTNLGAIFANISSGIAFKINSQISTNTPLNNTLFYNTALQTQNERSYFESFFGLKTHLTYQFWDKTVTGDLYRNDLNKTFNITPWIWHTDIGYYWSLKHWNFSYHQIFHTNNVKQMTKKWIRYGTIALSYKW